jgi:dihydroxyacetone kinase
MGLLIHSGDKINFRLAAEEARTKFGLKVGMVVIGDDVALLDDGPANAVGARGLAGVVFLHKILGAYAEAGSCQQCASSVVQQIPQSPQHNGA